MNSGRSKIEPVRIYLDYLRINACSTIPSRYVKTASRFHITGKNEGLRRCQLHSTPMEMKQFVITVHTHKRSGPKSESERPLQVMAKHLTNYLIPKKPLKTWPDKMTGEVKKLKLPLASWK